MDFTQRGYFMTVQPPGLQNLDLRINSELLYAYARIETYSHAMMQTGVNR